ncbi:MAG: hypothetical protein H0T46_18605 [Deltaproteobacteria bacterium]|nr:hypothetical protein [Deltaproteobacteria bacterium]
MTRERGLGVPIVERLDESRNPGRGLQTARQLLGNEVLVDTLGNRDRWPTDPP